jgi:N-acetylneuraminic acid mutarotase
LDGFGWTPIDSPETLPHRANHGCCYDSVNDRIYIYGGAANSQWPPLNLCTSYDPSTDRWYDEASMISPRLCIKGLYCRGKLYAIGGVSNSGGAFDSCEVYDIAANTWSPIPPLPEPIAEYEGGTWHDSIIYILGGYNDASGTLSSVWIYNPFTDTWTAGNSLLTGSQEGDACLIGDSIYIVGGIQPQGNYDSLMRIGAINPRIPTDISWSWGPVLPQDQGRYLGPVVALDGKVYWFGGILQGSTGTDLGYCYDPRTGEITDLPSYPTDVMNCCLAAARESRGEIYGLGGSQGVDGSVPAGYWRLDIPGFYDVGPVQVTAPWNSIDSGPIVTPVVVVGNFGRYPESFPVMLRIDSNWIDYESTSIAPQGTASVRFRSWDDESPGAHVIKCSTMMAGDEQPWNDVLYDTFDVLVFDAGINSLDLSESMPQGSFAPIAVIKNNGPIPGSIMAYWWILQNDTLRAYAQSESAYLAGRATQMVAFPSWNATPGVYLAKVFIMRGGVVYHDTVQARFVVVNTGVAQSGSEPPPQEFAFDIASTNPSRDQTVSLRYALPQASRLSLRVYDANGQVVRTLVDSRQEEGRYGVIWDRQDDRGCKLSAGVYLIRLDSPSFERTRKIVITQ